MINNILINNYNKLYNKINKKYKTYNIIILLDKNIYKLYIKYLILKIIKNLLYNYLYIIKINNGEKYKNIYTCIKIFKKLKNKQINKKSIFINFGGGVISDLGGFISSIYKRGIIFYNIPTTLLSMIDASIGGKNAININNLKNELGIFNNAKLILIDEYYLLTLNKKQIISGISEIIKYGLIFNKKLFYIICNNYKYNFNNKKWNKIIIKSILIKNIIINNDFKEKNFRQILNFGHTIGHSIEIFFLNKKISHGEAIAIGIIYESFISYKYNLIKKKKFLKIKQNILKIYNYLFYKILNNIKNNINNIINIMYYDKKNIFFKKINFVLLNNIGICNYNNNINNNIIKYCLYYTIYEKNKY
ncbi:MAG: 3-dehydroquinate synthase family protein [Candidatus Shikimatogenerans sp. Ttur]|uniref:3-dehydroquinate synthase family protein n=1 Tax=Candidatus Shikimatogenerans sp. Ttur TaxID=3158569 RepID=A0AAU7ZXG2_9FLAO